MFNPVEIDVTSVAESLSALFGRVVTEVEAVVHLRREGFIPYGDGWLASNQQIAALDHLLRGDVTEKSVFEIFPSAINRELALALGDAGELRNVG